MGMRLAAKAGGGTMRRTGQRVPQGGRGVREI